MDLIKGVESSARIMAKVLLVEDDLMLAAALQEELAGGPYQVETTSSGEDALQLLDHFQFDIILLDWNLPGINGLEVCKRFRQAGGLSFVIFLTSEGDISFKEQALDAGGDDYLVKPFDVRELVARMRSVSRRSLERVEDIISIGPVSLNPASRIIAAGGRQLQLTPKENAILEYLMRHKNRPFSALRLLNSVWPSDSEVSVDNVRVLVANLRQKLAAAGCADFVKTIHNAGYVVEDQSN